MANSPSVSKTRRRLSSSGVVLQDMERSMKIYKFTDSDLEAIGLANLVGTPAIAIGVAFLMISFDVNKDLLLLEQMTQNALSLQFIANWIAIPVAAVSLVVGLLAFFKRGSIIRRVKKESRSV